LREFIKISPQLLTYAEKLSRRSAEDINNYFKKILVKDGVYYTPENPELSLSNFTNQPKAKDYKYNYFGDKVSKEPVVRPILFDTIISNREKVEEEKRLKALSDNFINDFESTAKVYPSMQDIHLNKIRQSANNANLIREYVTGNNIDKQLEERNLDYLNMLKSQYKEEKEQQQRDNEARETNNMMKADLASQNRDFNGISYKKELEMLKELEDMKNTSGNESKDDDELKEKNMKVLEQLKDGNEGKEEVGIELNDKLPKTMNQLLTYKRERINRLYLELQKQYPDILTDELKSLTNIPSVANAINKVLQLETVDNQVATRSRTNKTKQPKDETPNKPKKAKKPKEETPENPKKVIQPPVMDTKPKEDYTTPVKKDNVIDLNQFSKTKLKKKDTNALLNDVRALINNDDIDEGFKRILRDMEANPQQFESNNGRTLLRDMLKRDNIEKYYVPNAIFENDLDGLQKYEGVFSSPDKRVLSKDFEPDTPALKEGKGLMKSNLSFLNKFKYR
jgi:hypothetical protein